MKKKFITLTLVAICLMMAGCGNTTAPSESNTSKQEIDIDKKPLIEYRKNSDGTYSTRENTYNYKFVLTGVDPKTKIELWFEVLTNNKDLTFKDINKYALNKDYNLLDKKETIIVNMGMNHSK